MCSIHPYTLPYPLTFIVLAIGMGMGMSSYSLALNTYFVKRRGKVTGISFTITGLGPILMPQLVTVLMYQYGVQGTMIILAGISAHTMISALLLQPIKWHMKAEELEDDNDKDGDEPENEKDTPLLISGNIPFATVLIVTAHCSGDHASFAIPPTINIAALARSILLTLGARPSSVLYLHN